MAPSWCKIDVEIGPCQSKKIDVIRVWLGSVYRSGRTRDWLKFKNPAAPAVKRNTKQATDLLSTTVLAGD